MWLDALGACGGHKEADSRDMALSVWGSCQERGPALLASGHEGSQGCGSDLRWAASGDKREPRGQPLGETHFMALSSPVGQELLLQPGACV